MLPVIILVIKQDVTLLPSVAKLKLISPEQYFMFVPNSDDTLASFLAPVSGECVH